jgi:hypothetical protein
MAALTSAIKIGKSSLDAQSPQGYNGIDAGRYRGKGDIMLKKIGYGLYVAGVVMFLVALECIGIFGLPSCFGGEVRRGVPQGVNSYRVMPVHPNDRYSLRPDIRHTNPMETGPMIRVQNGRGQFVWEYNQFLWEHRQKLSADYQRNGRP